MHGHPRHRRPTVPGTAILAALGLALAAAGGALAAGGSLAGTASVAGPAASGAAGGGAAALPFADGAVDRMNADFEGSVNETVYCGRVANGHVSIREIPVRHSNATSATFDIGQCTTAGDAERILLHSHPRGIDRLSEPDEAVLSDNGLAYGCIQHDTIERRDGRLVGLTCYSGSAPHAAVPATISSPPR